MIRNPIPYKTDYKPTLMGKDISNKNYPAPPQPNNMRLSARKLHQVINKCVSEGNIDLYKKIFDQIKILVRSVMKVRCDKKYDIDISLFQEIDNEKILEERNIANNSNESSGLSLPSGSINQQIIHKCTGVNPNIRPMPITSYSYDCLAHPEIQNNLCTGKMPKGKLFTTGDAQPRAPYIADVIISFPVPNYNYKDWTAIFRALVPSTKETVIRCACYPEGCGDGSDDDLGGFSESLIYAYQNLLLTVISHFRNEIAKSNKSSRGALENSTPKQTVYNWVNRIGDTYHRAIRAKVNKDSTRVEFMFLSVIKCLLNNYYFNELDPHYGYLMSYYNAYSIHEYTAAITYFRDISYRTENNDERLYYLTLVELVQFFYQFHYEKTEKILTDYNLIPIIERFLNKNVNPLDKTIINCFNRVVDSNYHKTYLELLTCPAELVAEKALLYVDIDPAQKCNIKLISQFSDKKLVIEKLLKSKGKRFPSYQNTITYMFLYGLLDINNLYDENLVPFHACLDIIGQIIESIESHDDPDYSKKNTGIHIIGELIDYGNKILKNHPEQICGSSKFLFKELCEKYNKN